MNKTVITPDMVRAAWDRAHAEYAAGHPHTGRMQWKIAKRLEERLKEQSK